MTLQAVTSTLRYATYLPYSEVPELIFPVQIAEPSSEGPFPPEGGGFFPDLAGAGSRCLEGRGRGGGGGRARVRAASACGVVPPGLLQSTRFDHYHLPLPGSLILANVGVRVRALWRKLGGRKGGLAGRCCRLPTLDGGDFCQMLGDLGANSCESGTGLPSYPSLFRTNFVCPFQALGIRARNGCQPRELPRLLCAVARKEGPCLRVLGLVAAETARGGLVETIMRKTVGLEGTTWMRFLSRYSVVVVARIDLDDIEHPANWL